MNQISGYFISFNDSEMTLISAALDDMGYSQDNTGIKNMILDACKEQFTENPEPPSLATTVTEFLKNNPEVLERGKMYVQGLMSRMIKK